MFWKKKQSDPAAFEPPKSYLPPAPIRFSSEDPEPGKVAQAETQPGAPPMQDAANATFDPPVVIGNKKKRPLIEWLDSKTDQKNHHGPEEHSEAHRQEFRASTAPPIAEHSAPVMPNEFEPVRKSGPMNLFDSIKAPSQPEPVIAPPPIPIPEPSTSLPPVAELHLEVNPTASYAEEQVEEPNLEVWECPSTTEIAAPILEIQSQDLVGIASLQLSWSTFQTPIAPQPQVPVSHAEVHEEPLDFFAAQALKETAQEESTPGCIQEVIEPIHDEEPLDFFHSEVVAPSNSNGVSLQVVEPEVKIEEEPLDFFAAQAMKESLTIEENHTEPEPEPEILSPELEAVQYAREQARKRWRDLQDVLDADSAFVFCENGHRHNFEDFLKGTMGHGQQVQLDTRNLLYFDLHDNYVGKTEDQGEIGWVPDSFGCPTCGAGRFRFQHFEHNGYTFCGSHLVKRGVKACPLCTEEHKLDEEEARIRRGEQPMPRAS